MFALARAALSATLAAQPLQDFFHPLSLADGEPRSARDVFVVFLWEDDGFHAGLAGAEDFFGDAAYGFHFAGEGNFSGHRHVLAEGFLFDGGEDGGGDGDAGGGAVHISSAHHIDVQIIIGEADAGEAADDRGGGGEV